ncbi:hypothetical protein D9M68_612450 [compost metagenome]
MIQFVDVFLALQTQALAGPYHRLAEGTALGIGCDLQRPLTASEFGFAQGMVLDATEGPSHGWPAPTAGAIGVPFVVVSGVPPHVHHAVDRAGAPQHLASRPDLLGTPARGIYRNRMVPGMPGVTQQLAEPLGHTYQRATIVGPRLDQQNAISPAFGEPVSKYAASRTRSDDDVVEILHVYLSRLPTR